ncbi:MAG: M1 family metallopeptidase [Candidatus Nomurabacteria bacterium]|jgi:aminopeptidase N|nr:M1 family metallopeptidase [Candidatus Nomurabacteria bacterium]
MERFLDYFVPSRYDLDAVVDKGNRRLDGAVEITGEVLGDSVKLHAVGMKIEAFAVEGKVVQFELVNGVLAFKSDAWRGNEVVIEIKFSLELNENMQGVYLSRYKYDGREDVMVVTQFESHYARECFPCVDEPAAKAVFRLNVSSVDSGDTVITNMPEGEDTPRMSTYLVAFAVGKFNKLEMSSKGGVKVTTYAGLHQPIEALRYATEYATKCLDFYIDLFDTPFPLPKLDQLAVPDFEAGAMENWGLMTFREQALLCDEKSALDQRLYVSTVIAHEISHMWFGDLVTMAWWDDLWLNESFASLMETYATDKLVPELDAWDDFYMGTVVPALRRDCLPGVQPVKVAVNNVEDIANLFDGAIVYAKGARLMLMLMRLMGEEHFFRGLKDYFAKHQYENTVANDLWESLTPHASFDVKAFMTPWLTQPGYPAISDGGQKRFLIAEGEGSQNYQYPVTEVVDDLSGHYILHLSDGEFARALGEIGQKNKEQKLRLLLDRELLAKTSACPSVSLLSLTKKFEGERAYVIWDAISLVVADLKIFVQHGSEEEAQYKEFVGKLAQPLYGELGVVAKDGESDEAVRLRSIIFGLMCYADNQDFVDAVVEKYEGEEPAQIDANLRAVILTVLLRQDEAREKEYLEAYLRGADPELKADLMAALTATRNTETVAKYLPLLRNGKIKSQDRLYFFARLVRNAVAKKQALDWMYENWDFLAADEGDKTVGEYPRIVASAIRKRQEAEQYRSFFESKMKELILTRNISVGLSEIKAKLALIAADAPEIKEFLKNLQK